jgi:hypothetical protein
MERSTSRDYQQSPWRTSSEATSTSTLLTEQSEYMYNQSQGAHGNEDDYRQQNTSKLETSSQSHYPSTSIEQEVEQSTQGHTNDGDAKDDITEVDLYDTTPFETVLPMADPTLPDTGIERDDHHELYSNDSVTVMVTDDASHEAGTPMPVDDDLPVPTVGEQGHDQDWESTYVVEDRAAEVTLSVPQPAAKQLAPDIMESIYNAADDSMADVTANPWTTT